MNEISDNAELKSRFKTLQLKLPLEELNKLSDKDQKQIYADLYYLRKRLYGIATHKNSCFLYEISPHRQLYISSKNGIVNLYVVDETKHQITQYITLKELQRINFSEGFILKNFENFDEAKDKNMANIVRKTTQYIHVIINQNEKHSKSICPFEIDEDFDFNR